MFYNRISQRVDVLEKITKLDKEVIENNVLLEQEYNSILRELGSAQDMSITNITYINDTSDNENIKFVSGGILFWSLSFLFCFLKIRKIFQL